MKKYLALSAVCLSLFAVPALAGMGEKDGHGGPGKRGGPERMEKMFEKNDLDGDGAISKEEFLKSAEERFIMMDENGDGKVTKEEAKASHDKMHEKMKAWREEHGKKDGTEPPPPPAESE